MIEWKFLVNIHPVITWQRNMVGWITKRKNKNNELEHTSAKWCTPNIRGAFLIKAKEMYPGVHKQPNQFCWQIFLNHKTNENSFENLQEVSHV